MNTLPSGSVTFLFSDIEGSTRLWEAHPVAMKAVIARHDALAASAIAEHGCALVKSRGEGDSLFAAFARASDDAACSCTLQRAIMAEPWPQSLSLRVRMACTPGKPTSETATLRHRRLPLRPAPRRPSCFGSPFARSRCSQFRMHSLWGL